MFCCRLFLVWCDPNYSLLEALCLSNTASCCFLLALPLHHRYVLLPSRLISNHHVTLFFFKLSIWHFCWACTLPILTAAVVWLAAAHFSVCVCVMKAWLPSELFAQRTQIWTNILISQLLRSETKLMENMKLLEILVCKQKYIFLIFYVSIIFVFIPWQESVGLGDRTNILPFSN